MKREDFLNLIIDKCDIDADEPITESTILEDLEDWDSLTFITVLSIFKTTFGESPEINKLKECKTFRDILNCAGEKYES